ncbi:MAG: radical SAM protein [Tannerella sp.]|jgi:pyruvate formate lyase activating enzyme|nr:radical SAM protein [Tannerella sp.]
MKKGIIFSIEEFAIHDGPGIRTTIFLKGCPLHCVWCHNPEGISPLPQIMTKKGTESICGFEMTSGELAAMMNRNKEVFVRNKGGITLTGGEPLMQSDFIIEFLQMIPDIHKAIETCGYALEDVFRTVVSLSDLILFDIKHTDPDMHERFTGRNNELIFRNLQHLCDSSKAYIARIPLIPGINDTPENMRAIAELLKNSGSLVRVELLRYHKTAGAKYSMIGREYNPPFDVDKAPRIYSEIFEAYNITTLIA